MSKHKTKKRPNIKRSKWNDIDRRAFADGVRVRAQTIPAKPKPKPETKEWKE